MFRSNGTRIPILNGAAAFGGQPNPGVAYILDLMERRRAEAGAHESNRRPCEAQVSFSHSNRVTATGQFSPSFAHELRQHVCATATNAKAVLSSLERVLTELEQLQRCLGWIVQDAERAGEVVSVYEIS